jgi:hypothetical protein
MAHHSINSSPFAQYSARNLLSRWHRRSVWFVIATIVLHFLFLQSANWHDWTLNKQTGSEQSVEVRFNTLEEKIETDAEKPHEENLPQKKAISSTPKAVPIAKVTPAPTVSPTSEAPTETVPDSKPINQPTTTTSDTAVEVVQEITGDKTSTPTVPTLESSSFALRIPESVDMETKIVRTPMNGSSDEGTGIINWATSNGSYVVTVEANYKILITINLLRQTSEGTISTFGITPTKSTDTRLNRAMTAVHFNEEAKSITFSSSNKTVPMQNGAQDLASMLFQLAAIGNADATQFTPGREFIIQVADARTADSFVFTVLDDENLTLNIDNNIHPLTEPIKTVHIVRPPRIGSYNSTIDIWLAPSLGWYPIQIRHTESNGTITTQTVTKLFQKINRDQ